MKFLRFQKTIALQRYVMFLRDSLTRLPKEQLHYIKKPLRMTRRFANQMAETTFKIVSAARCGETASQLFCADSSFRM